MTARIFIPEGCCACCDHMGRTWFTGRRWLCRDCWRNLLQEDPA